jgi:hypothetical protein
LVDHNETSAVCEGTEIRLTELRKFGCGSSVEKLAAFIIRIHTLPTTHEPDGRVSLDIKTMLEADYFRLLEKIALPIPWDPHPWAGKIIATALPCGVTAKSLGGRAGLG